jgi:hypothetical protein
MKLEIIKNFELRLVEDRVKMDIVGGHMRREVN